MPPLRHCFSTVALNHLGQAPILTTRGPSIPFTTWTTWLADLRLPSRHSNNVILMAFSFLNTADSQKIASVNHVDFTASATTATGGKISLPDPLNQDLPLILPRRAFRERVLRIILVPAAVVTWHCRSPPNSVQVTCAR